MIKISESDFKYLPVIICQLVIGLVFNISIVPSLISSEKLLMVIAGIRKIKNHGVIKKKLFKSANPALRMLKSPLNTHKKRPLITRNTEMTRYPIGEAKNEFNSFLKIAIITLKY